MLRKGIKYLLLVIVFSSCHPETKHNVQDVRATRSNEYIKNNFKTYDGIYNVINDSIGLYIKCALKDFTAEFIYGYELDSMVCVDSHREKLVAIIIEKAQSAKNVPSEFATGILGKKIDGKWYFFCGVGTLIIPRDMYGYSDSVPPTQYFLSQVARKELLEGSLIKGADGNYIVDDKWIDEQFYNPGYDSFTHHKIDGVVSRGEEYQMPRDKEKTDSVHWVMIMDKWKHKIDTNEYKRKPDPKSQRLP